MFGTDGKILMRWQQLKIQCEILGSQPHRLQHVRKELSNLDVMRQICFETSA